MMTAMMLPAVWPWLRLFGAMAPRAWPGRRAGPVRAQFAAGYFAVWGAYSVAAAGLQSGLHELALLRADLTLGATAAGAVLLAAGLFQLTPMKDACLKHCRNRLGFFLERWHDGPAGPFRMGARHGAFCVACCWALMLLALVLGVMNLLWMAALTAMVVAEQRAPRARHLRQVLGIALGAWGLVLLLRP
jgi:predicted metal-binding membrane protein